MADDARALRRSLAIADDLLPLSAAQSKADRRRRHARDKWASAGFRDGDPRTPAAAMTPAAGTPLHDIGTTRGRPSGTRLCGNQRAFVQGPDEPVRIATCAIDRRAIERRSTRGSVMVRVWHKSHDVAHRRPPAQYAVSTASKKRGPVVAQSVSFIHKARVSQRFAGAPGSAAPEASTGSREHRERRSPARGSLGAASSLGDTSSQSISLSRTSLQRPRASAASAKTWRSCRRWFRT